MKEFIDKFNKISELKPRIRGTRFERLLYEIFERENILLLKFPFFYQPSKPSSAGAIDFSADLRS